MFIQLLKSPLAKLIFLITLLGNSALAKDNIPPKSDTVIFVHGFLRTSKNMSALASSFKKDGWHVENWSYPSRQKYIEEHAKDLVHRLNQIAKTQPGKPISFVTHSMGGLVVRCALNQLDCPNEAKMGRAVLIAPPNRGSEFARSLYKYKLFRSILGNKSGNQLMTTPLDGFDRLGSFPEYMPVLVISGTAGINPLISKGHDGKVGVNETHLSTPHFHEKSFAGHSWICHTPTVIKKTKEFISRHEKIITPSLIHHQEQIEDY